MTNDQMFSDIARTRELFGNQYSAFLRAYSVVKSSSESGRFSITLNSQ